MGEAHRLMGEKNVEFTMANGQRGSYKNVRRNPNYMPHITDWDIKLTDPQSGETKTLREITDDRTLNDTQRLRYLEEKRQELGASEQTKAQWLEAIKRDRKRLYGPHNPNITERRELDHPFYHKDLWALDNYFRQVASATSLAESFGSDMGKLKTAVSKIPSARLRKDIISSISTIFEPQDWDTWMGKVVRHGQGIEALTKMTLSPISVSFHGIHAVLGLGRKRNASYQGAGSLVEQPTRIHAREILYGRREFAYESVAFRGE